jgi:D-ribose pyranose/furanose isomerase RbsD
VCRSSDRHGNRTITIKVAGMPVPLHRLKIDVAGKTGTPNMLTPP